ncbi:uncharacterized protein LOC108458919 [Gossypium arboreum]|uniref:uncharacterized protein LOC108458919 n=1 Tax=Gossypium arboreum TaxID=29729 RepID=UPI00081925C1|nr:uncharacterized protein LOC108458919 [Gossypium arboreum]
MSTRGTRGRGRGRGPGSARAGSWSVGHQHNEEAREAPASPMAKIGSQNRVVRDEVLSQAMLRILERVAGPSTGTVDRGSVTERLRSTRAKIFRGIAGVAPNVAEYWLEATERIMDDLNCTPEQKLKGAVSLFRDEAYQWWLTVKKGTQADRLTWEFFKTTFQAKCVGTSYMDARRKELLNLTQGDRTVAEYEAEFLRIAAMHDFAALVDKAKIPEKVKRTKCQNRKKGRGKRDAEPSNSFRRPKKKAKADGPIRIGAPATATGPQFCVDCGRWHQSEY